MNINTSKISNNNCYVNRNNPKYIVIHETDNYNKGANAERHATAQCNGNLDTSVHYYVDDHSIYKVLEHCNGAWAVGDGRGVYGIKNTNSINIEICVNPDNDYEKSCINCIELVKYLMSQTAIPANRVVRHYDASRKKCPKKMIDNPKLWEDFKRSIQGCTTNITPSVPNNTSIDESVRDKVGVITGNGVNVRLDAGMNGTILGTVNKGDKVTLWSLEGEWYHCYSLYKGYNRCYIHKDYVKIINEAAISNPVQTKQETWKLNINGDIIRELQNELNIQYNAGIKVDGWAGDITIDYLPVVRQGAKGNITRIIQKILLLKGYKLPKYGADGTFGEEMKTAVLQVQKDNGLSADSVIGRNTWKALLRK